MVRTQSGEAMRGSPLLTVGPASSELARMMKLIQLKHVEMAPSDNEHTPQDSR